MQSYQAVIGEGVPQAHETSHVPRLRRVALLSPYVPIIPIGLPIVLYFEAQVDHSITLGDSVSVQKPKGDRRTAARKRTGRHALLISPSHFILPRNSVEKVEQAE